MLTLEKAPSRVRSDGLKNYSCEVFSRNPKITLFFGNFSILSLQTKVHEIKDVSLAGEKMPQKSTYFYPKLVTGIVMNKF